MIQALPVNQPSTVLEDLAAVEEDRALLAKIFNDVPVDSGVILTTAFRVGPA